MKETPNDLWNRVVKRNLKWSYIAPVLGIDVGAVLDEPPHHSLVLRANRRDQRCAMTRIDVVDVASSGNPLLQQRKIPRPRCEDYELMDRESHVAHPPPLDGQSALASAVLPQAADNGIGLLVWLIPDLAPVLLAYILVDLYDAGIQPISPTSLAARNPVFLSGVAVDVVGLEPAA